MKTHIDVLVARTFEEFCVLRVLYPKQWVSFYTSDINGEIYLCNRGFLELSLAGFTPVAVPVTLAYEKKCFGAETPDGTIFFDDGGRYVKVADALYPTHIRDYICVSYEVACEANVEWVGK